MSSVLSISDFTSLIDGVDKSSELASVPWKQFHEFVLNVEKVVLARVESKSTINQRDNTKINDLRERYLVACSHRDQLLELYEGEGMTDQLYTAFSTLRDVTIPSIRDKLLEEFLKD